MPNECVYKMLLWFELQKAKPMGHLPMGHLNSPKTKTNGALKLSKKQNQMGHLNSKV